jgi:integrase
LSCCYFANALITAGDADEWRQKLLATLATATVSRDVKRARQFLQAAVRKQLIPLNPFIDLPTPAQVNDAREYFVSREEAARVLEACPDAEWRLIFALSRFGGLRTPSEHLALKWGHVDWQRGRLIVPSPKTEKNRKGASRTIPIFPELLPHLEACWANAEPGQEYVVTRYRDSNANLRTQLNRIIARAGLEPWPKLFHNLRATRQTELAADYPLHVVCEWIGNSAAIASQHYLTVSDADYQRAAQNAAQSVHEQGCRTLQEKMADERKPLVLQSVAPLSDLVHNCKVPPRGVEPLSPP